MKGGSQEQIISAICAVNEGVAWLDPGIARLVLSNIQKTNTPEDRKNLAKNQYGLTERELDVLKLMVDGYTNPEISEKLVIEASTTKTHVHHILQIHFYLQQYLIHLLILLKRKDKVSK